jgi:hypothetical protein
VRERRRSLTPLESELRLRERAPVDRKPGPLERMRARRRDRRPPTTLRGAVARGLIRLAISTAVASGIALLVDHWTSRGSSFGFYVVGAGLLAIAFFTSASPMGSRVYYYTSTAGEREKRVSMSFAYILAGAIVIVIGVVIDLVSR